MKKKLFLHIGTYKTGSTSLQQFALDHAHTLRRNGIALYCGQFRECNHMELHLAALRYERDSFAKLGPCKHITFDERFTEQVAHRVRSFLRSCAEPSVLLTSEGLSLLRHDDEINRLRNILDADNTETTVILYLRDKDDFLRSYTSQLLKVRGRKPSNDFWSALYVERDTWLTDYDSLISAYQNGFGPNNVVVIDYDAEMKERGNIIPSFLDVLGMSPTESVDLSSYFLNTTAESSAIAPQKGWSQRAKQAWLKWLRRRAA